MSRTEINQVPIFEQLKAKTMKQKDAAKKLGISLRQVKRKLKAYRANGAVSLIHGARGKPSHNRIDETMKQQALALVENEYSDFKPSFAAEKLAKHHDLIIHPETLRLAMAAAGLWQVGKRRSTHREWRERRACFGELIQLDGSPHDWFEGRSPKCTLLAFIDDATGKVLQLFFVYEEATVPIMQATKDYFEAYGRPVSLYMDRGKVFKVNIHNEEGERITQYRRALEEFGCEVIYARSPEAKGRVERLFGTLQDRLVKELRLAKISTMEEANQFLKDGYIDEFNARFAIEPREPQDLHCPVSHFDLDAIFCVKETRTLQNDFTIRYQNRWFQLEEKQPTILFPKDPITISTYLDGSVHLAIRKTTLNFREIEKPEPIDRKEPTVRPLRVPYKPSPWHPWRQYEQAQLRQKVTF